jgi:hypothetical protein
MVGVSGIRSIKVAYRVIEIKRGAIVARPGQPSADRVAMARTPDMSPLCPHWSPGHCCADRVTRRPIE